MKSIIAACMLLMLVGCEDRPIGQVEQVQVPHSTYTEIKVDGAFRNFQYTIVKIDGCEYIWYWGGGDYALMHKANCSNHGLNQIQK